MRASLLYLIFFLIAINQVYSQSALEKTIQDFLQKSEYQNASLGFHVLDMESGSNMFEHQSNKLMIPGSILKIITTATAIEVLGAEYRFQTKLAYKGTIGDKGVLNGDIVLIGGADPTLGSEYFEAHYANFLENWVEAIRSAGIKRVKGKLVLDASVYDDIAIPSTWIWEDMGNYFGAGPSAFTVYDNLFRISFRSPPKAGKLTSIKSIYPEIEGMRIGNKVLSANNIRDNAWVYGSPLDKTRVIRGTIPANRKNFTIKAANHHPAETLSEHLIAKMRKAGIQIDGDTQFQEVDKGQYKTLYTQYSPQLQEIVKVINHKSVNLFAEHLLRQLAVEKNGIGNNEDALEILNDYWVERGIAKNAIFMEDGSGLSHFNAFSARNFTKLLHYMQNTNSFRSSFPSAGEGTLSVFSPHSFPNRSLRAKSGSMKRVRSYAGYLTLDSGGEVCFCIMVNHFSGSHSKLIREIEKILVEVRKL